MEEETIKTNLIKIKSQQKKLIKDILHTSTEDVTFLKLGEWKTLINANLQLINSSILLVEQNQLNKIHKVTK